jgi:hypothetical protein
VLVINIAEELEVVSEPLGPRELPNGADPVLFRMNNLKISFERRKKSFDGNKGRHTFFFFSLLIA